LILKRQLYILIPATKRDSGVLCLEDQRNLPERCEVIFWKKDRRYNHYRRYF